VLREELAEIREHYADARRTEIVEDYADLTIEDLIPDESLLVTLSHGGYAKAQPLGTYQAQRRGGRGRAATRVKDEDFIDQLFVANAHDTLLCFSSRGKVYWLKVYQLPQAGPGARGRPIVNLLPLEPAERINAVLPIRTFEQSKYVLFATSRGTVKKTPLSAFSRPLASGIIAVELRGDDRLIGAGITDGVQDLMLFSRSGKAIRFSECDVRPMGRNAAGVRGLRLGGAGDEVIALCIPDGGRVLIATENGYGKRTALQEFPVQGRGGQGVIAIQASDRNGPVVGAVQVAEDDEVMLISSGGTLVRTGSSEISIMGRNTQGVRLIRLDEDDRLVGLERIEVLQEQDGAAGG
ncbi:MAG: DNA gyrase subunit A, partial [Rhodospirillaceae bacterium]|nr:DNA gyrase subunit A [Rhodospirillaceae bacterium]